MPESVAKASERVVDEEARLTALDPRRSFIVQAPAGSGKTELLIQRFLTLLGRVDEPESIVAVTFTRKAAAEMRHRVIRALIESASSPPEEDHELQSWHLAQAALVRNQERGWRITEFPARLRIQTIDSLCGNLVRRMPWISRMGAVPEPEERSEHLYRRAAQATLDLLEDPGPAARLLHRLLGHLDNDRERVETLLQGMLRRRDQWLRHIVPHPGSDTLRSFLEAGLHEIIKDELEAIRSLFPADQGAARDLPEADPEHVGRWFEISELLLTKKGEPRKGLDSSANAVGTLTRSRLANLEFDEAVRGRLHALRFLPSSSFSDAQWEVLCAFMELLPMAVAQLKLVFQQEGRVDFTEIAHAARTALGTPERPTDLAFAMDCRIEHLLVDEFQDTSQTQYELLHALIADWQPGDGRTLFVVGDPMQSIYGFREAEVGLFLRARKGGIGSVRLEPLNLSVNFRSDAGIVHWVNRTMSPAFAREEDLLTGAVTYARSEPFRAGSEPPAVTIHPFFEGDAKQEAELVLDIIGQSQTQDPEGTIAVLGRSRGHLVEIVSALRRAGKRFQALEVEPLGTRPAVQDLWALTCGLLHPADRPAWLAMLRAPWCGLTLADLDALAGGDLTASIWDLLQDEPRLETLSSDGRSRLRRLVQAIQDSMAVRGRLSLRCWVERTWIALGGPATLSDSTGLEDAAAYLDLLDELSVGAELEDFEKFRAAVQSLFGRPDVAADERLQLLTIHKAKGLEFDTVIIPGLGKTIRTTERELLLWQEYVNARGDARLLLAPIHEMGAEKDPIYEYIRRIRASKEDHESIRLLYVAATRARRRLHLLGHTATKSSNAVRPPRARSLLAKIWHTAGPIFEEASRTRRWRDHAVGSSIHMTNRKGVGLSRLVADWTPPALRQDVDWEPPFAIDMSEESADRDGSVKYDWASDLQRRVGSVVHAILSEMRDGESDLWGNVRVRAALRAEGLHGKPLEEAVHRVRKAVAGTLEDTRGRWILACHDEDGREYPLSGLVGGRLRRSILDRTFVERGIRWIIDYKTGTHEGSGVDAFLDTERERYRSQLEDYGRLMRGMDARPIRLGLYFPMLQGWREWPFEECEPQQ